MAGERFGFLEPFFDVAFRLIQIWFSPTGRLSAGAIGTGRYQFNFQNTDTVRCFVLDSFLITAKVHGREVINLKFTAISAYHDPAWCTTIALKLQTGKNDSHGSIGVIKALADLFGHINDIVWVRRL